MSLAPLYAHRFPPENRRAKDAIWQVLCRSFFQKYVAPDAAVVDLGAGFCEFLRHTHCRERIAVDLNPALADFAPPGTRLIQAPAHQLGQHLADGSTDVVFASNFFEHLPGDGGRGCGSWRAIRLGWCIHRRFRPAVRGHGKAKTCRHAFDEGFRRVGPDRNAMIRSKRLPALGDLPGGPPVHPSSPCGSLRSRAP